MANLTTEQAQSLWDNRFQSEKKSCDGAYDCYYFASRLDGYNYYLSYHHSDNVILDTNTAAEIEAQVKADLANAEYQGVKPVETIEII